MKLGDIQSPFHRKKIITYASDGCTAVVKNTDVQYVSDYLYKGRNRSDRYGQTFCRFYIYYPELGIGIEIGGIAYPDSRTAEEIQSGVPSALLQGPKAFIAELDRAVAEGKRIVNAQIELARRISPEKVEIYIEARQKYLDRQKEKHEQARKQKEEEDAAYCKEKNEEAQKQIDQALKIIRNDGELDNDYIQIFHSRYDCRSYQIVNYLAREYGVEIPLKVQGWINNSLIRVIIQDGKTVRIRHSGRISKTIWGYMDQLIQAIRRR